MVAKIGKESKFADLRKEASKVKTDSMFVTFYLFPEVADDAIQNIQPDFWKPEEYGKREALKVLASVRKEYTGNVRPPFEDLYIETESWFEELGEGMPESQYNEILAVPGEEGDQVGLLYHAYKVASADDFTTEKARGSLRRWVKERVGYAQRQADRSFEGFYPKDPAQQYRKPRSGRIRSAARCGRRQTSTPPSRRTSWLGGSTSGTASAPGSFRSTT
jgi:hypothetical protein